MTKSWINRTAGSPTGGGGEAAQRGRSNFVTTHRPPQQASEGKD